MAVTFLAFLHVVDLEKRVPVQASYNLVYTNVLLVLLLLRIIDLHEVVRRFWRPFFGYVARLLCICQNKDVIVERLDENIRN